MRWPVDQGQHARRRQKEGEGESGRGGCAPESGGAANGGIVREEQIRELMVEGFLPVQAISQWKMPGGDAIFPSEDNGEVTVFCRYIELGFGLPASDFFLGGPTLLWIQTSHLSLKDPDRSTNGDLHMAIFVHLCEAVLGIDPHLKLFLHYFWLKNVPKDEDLKYIGGAALQFKQEM